MRGLSLFAILLIVFFSADAAKCRGRYMEMRGADGFVAARGGCRGLDSQIQEEYWTTVGFDGALRDGRTTDDFLVFPDNENNGHLQRNSFVAYWITRSKYGENVHYEAFGHGFIKPDGKVCGWFVGSQKEVVEVCGGFRILSRSRHNPHQPIPFEWVQNESLRNRDVLGFHHHKIAKYEVNGDEVLFGDADVKGKKFNGVSVSSEERVQVDTPETFHRKVWLLRKKGNQQPSDNRVPLNIVSDPKRREDLDIYKDPHHEERILNWRLYPYYDQYGRPSSSQVDAHRPAYDSAGRRLAFDGSAYSQQAQNAQNSQISNNYQFYDANQQPPRNHPGYEEWLRNQYRIRGIVPRGYNQDNNNYDMGQYEARQKNTNRVDFHDVRGFKMMEYLKNNQAEQPAYALQPSSGNTDSNPNNQVFYEESSSNGENSRNQNSESQNGETYYSVNPGAPVDATGTETQVDSEFQQIRVPGEPNGNPETVESDNQQHVRFIRYHPPTVIRDKKGNIYERRVENGKVHYVDASGNEVRAKIDDSKIDMKIEKILENRRRQEEKMRNLLGDSENSENSETDPITAAEVARQG